jgi:hypothetical protein
MYLLVEILTPEDEFACYLEVPADQDLILYINQTIGEFYQTQDYKIGQINNLNKTTTSNPT